MLWKIPFDDEDSIAQQLFTPLQMKSFSNDVACSRDKFIARVVSTSFIALMDEEKRNREIIQPILTICDTHNLPDEFAYPYISYVYSCRAK